MLPLFVVIPLAAAFVISLIGKKFRWAGDILANLASLALLVLSFFALRVLHSGSLPVMVYKVGGWGGIPPLGICMVLDGLSCFMLIILNIVSFLVAVYSINYMDKYTSKYRFYTLFMLMLAGMNGVIITGDMFNLFVFLEIAAIASYALVAFGTESEELEASFKYSIMGSVASSFILLGIGLLYSYTSSLNMADICVVLAAKGHSNIVSFISVLFLMGFGLKAAIVPFHAWLPDAHPSAPAPISAMLSGVFIKTLGVYALCRVFFNVIGISAALSFLLVILGIISMSIVAFLAIGQSDIKRMLAYSSISQIGYIIFAIGIGTPLAILGGLFHLANHAIFKSLLFLNSGAVEYSIKTRDLGQMGGLNKRLPVTGYTSLVASMSISGIPPLSGFWSKLIIIVAAIQAKYFGSAIIAVLISILTLAYYLKLQRYAFFGELNKKWEKIKEVPWSMKLAMVTLSIICLLAGVIYLPELSRIFLEPAVNVMLAGEEYAGIVLGAMK
ncbi:MAG: NADH/ubiquinone/plastoquinone (complex I) [Candidatus Omnitrophica bacterium]|nr:NADH/ubiquinone/plastoquinone (complex I) [Candidatus Omnitrophota bacterium]